MGDFHRGETAPKVELTLDAITYLSLKEWDAYIAALQTKQQALTAEYNTAIELRKQK